jgi:hypothetical protein
MHDLLSTCSSLIQRHFLVGQTWLWAACLCLWLTAGITSTAALWLPWGSLLPWLASFVPFVFLARRLDTKASADLYNPHWQRWETSVVIALTGAAFLLRILWLVSIPENFGGDEGEMGMEARAVLEGKLDNPFVTSWLTHPTLWFFLQAGSMWVLGDSVFGIRALSALCGVLTIPVFYFFVRPWNRELAIIGTLLMAAFPIHIHFSRLATNNVADPLLSLVALGWLIDGIRRDRSLSFAVAGLTAGLAQHMYMGARLCVILALVIGLWTVATGRFKRGHWTLFFFGLLLGTGPLVNHFVEFPEKFMARMNQVGIFQSGWFAEKLQEGWSLLEVLGVQVWNSVSVLFFKPLSGEYFDLQTPLFGPLMSVLVLLGVAYTSRRLKTDFWFLCLAWLFCGLLFTSVLLVPPPQPHRLASLAPLFCILAAAGILQLWALFERVLLLRADLVRTGVRATAVVLALEGVFFYFSPSPHSLYGWSNTDLSNHLARHVAQSGKPGYTYFFGAPRVYFDNGIFKFLRGRARGEDVIDDWEPDTPAPEGAYQLHFAFVLERLDELGTVEQSIRTERCPSSGIATQAKSWPFAITSNVDEWEEGV